jgi:hypothetical protein
MAAVLYKWFLLLSLLPAGMNKPVASGKHPFFISVTEIEHNAKAKTLEISCKIFTDDFEKTLRKSYTGTVDLVNVKDKTTMDRLVSSYVQQHLVIKADDKTVSMKFIGFERQEEAVYAYFEADNIATVKKIAVTDNILFDYKNEQMNIVHATVGGTRKSAKLNNPDDKWVFEF